MTDEINVDATVEPDDTTSDTSFGGDFDFSAAPATPTLVFGDSPSQSDATITTSGTAAATDLSEYTEKLSKEELAQVDEFSKTIDLHNTTAIMQYGAAAQHKMSTFSEAALKNVRTKDLGIADSMLTGLVSDLKGFKIDEEEKGLSRFFKKTHNKIVSLQAKYDSVEQNINKVSKDLEKYQITLLKDIAMLDKMYDANLAYFKELNMYILAGKKRLEEIRATELADAMAKANASGSAEDAQAVRDLQDQLTRFEKKLYDLELTRTISIQTAPQIRLVQNSDALMSEKIQTTIVNTIPLWKNQMVVALGIEHASQAAHAQKEVSEFTNALLKKNADTLKTATIEAAKESERGIVDIETLEHTNESLITTLDELLQIQNEGRAKRQAAEADLQNMENQLKQKLLEINTK